MTIAPLLAVSLLTLAAVAAGYLAGCEAQRLVLKERAKAATLTVKAALSPGPSPAIKLLPRQPVPSEAERILKELEDKHGHA